jgi:ubiquinone/menaquinone biosynthesis C-methylase UbiE
MTKNKDLDSKVTKNWDRDSKTWSENVRAGGDVYRDHFNNPNFFKFIGSLDGKTVLDAGCGEGYNTRIVSKQCNKVIGVDISQKMIEFANQQEQENPLGIEYKTASYSDLKIFADESFDTVLSFMSLMDCADYNGAIEEFFRILKPGGDLFFNITHPCFFTKGYDWIEDENGKKIKLCVAEYFSNEPWEFVWKFSHAPDAENTEPFRVMQFSRTLSTYLNGLLTAGFNIKKIDEPRPPLQACEKSKNMNFWRDHAAVFLYINAQKGV